MGGQRIACGMADERMAVNGLLVYTNTNRISGGGLNGWRTTDGLRRGG